MNTSKNVQYLKDDTLVEITVSGAFYKRLQALLIYTAQKKTLQEFQVLYANLSQGNEPLSEYDFHLQTIFGIVTEIEHKANQQGKTSEEPVEDFMKKLEEFKNKQEELMKEQEEKNKSSNES